MSIVLFSFFLALIFSFFLYWYFKFKFILPIEKKISYIDKGYFKFQVFSREIIKHNYIPESPEQLNELITNTLIKLHTFFSESSILLFERDIKTTVYSDQENNLTKNWKITHSIFSEILNSDSLNSFIYGLLNKVIKENDLLFIEDLGDNFKNEKFEKIALIPLSFSNFNTEKVIMIGLKDRENFNLISPYLKHIWFTFLSFYKVYDKVINLKTENSQIKKELNVLTKELDMTGSSLIKKAKERKAIYDVISSPKTDLLSSLDSIINISFRILEADIIEFLSYNEEKKGLESQIVKTSNLIKDFSVNFIPLKNNIDISVRSFIEKKCFLIPDKDLEKNNLDKEYEELNIKSIIIVPVYLEDNILGIIKAGSLKKGFFNKEHLEFLSLIRDQVSEITGILNLNKILSDKAQELVQINRIKDDFLSTVSHELKTPLTTIKGFVSVLLSGEVGTMTDQQISFLNIVDQAANRLSNLISNLLDISKLEGKIDFDKSEFDLVETVHYSINTLAIKAKEKNIKLNFIEPKGENIYVLGDRHWIMQVTDNLITNAIKHSLSTQEINVSIEDRGDVVVVSVKDYGQGIDEVDVKHIFNKFYRGKNTLSNTEGTGLGLSISKSVIEKHNGKIWVESVKGKGANFYYALPKMKK